MIHSYTVHQLSELADCGFRITFVSSSPWLNNIDTIKDLCCRILWRHNSGHDFGSYKDGLFSIGSLEHVKQLIMMNDSTYGPLWPLSRLLEDFNPDRCDFWGVTDSWQHSYHLQSYFLSFFPRAFLHPEFTRFWARLPYVSRRNWIIPNAEIKLTKTLSQAQLRSDAYCEYWKVHNRFRQRLLQAVGDQDRKLGSETFTVGSNQLTGNVLASYLVRKDTIKDEFAIAPSAKEMLQRLELGITSNPTGDFWDLLLTEFKSPFLKRELLLESRARRPYTWLWDSAVAEISDYPLDLIRNHLKCL